MSQTGAFWWLHHRPRRVHQLSAVVGLPGRIKTGPRTRVAGRPRPSFDGVVSGLRLSARLRPSFLGHGVAARPSFDERPGQNVGRLVVTGQELRDWHWSQVEPLRVHDVGMPGSPSKLGHEPGPQVVHGPRLMAWCPVCGFLRGCGHHSWATGRRPGPRLMSDPVRTSAASSRLARSCDWYRSQVEPLRVHDVGMPGSPSKLGHEPGPQVVRGPRLMAWCPVCGFLRGCGHHSGATGRRPGPRLMSDPVRTSAASSRVARSCDWYWSQWKPCASMTSACPQAHQSWAANPGRRSSAALV